MGVEERILTSRQVFRAGASPAVPSLMICVSCWSQVDHISMGRKEVGLYSLSVIVATLRMGLSP